MSALETRPSKDRTGGRTPGAPFAGSTLGTLAVALVVLALASPAVAGTGAVRALHEYTMRTWRQLQGLPQSSITALAQDAHGFLWVGTQKGLARFDGVRFHIFTHDSIPALADNWITALVSRPQLGEVWIGTLSGLCVYHEGVFIRVDLGGERRTSIRDLAELPDGRMLAGTLEGPFVVTGRRGAQIDSLRGEPVTASLVVDRRIWIAGRKLIELDQTLLAKRSLELPDARRGGWIDGLAYDGKRLWLATDHGLLRLQSPQLEPSPWARLASTPVRAVCHDRHGALWVATETDLIRVRPDAEPEYFVDPDVPRQVRRLLEDREGNVWAGSIGFGLARFSLGRLVSYGPGQGLRRAATWSVAPGRDGLWLGTMDGVAYLRAEQVKVVLPVERLPHPRIWSLYDDGRTLWIGTRAGLARYDVASNTLGLVPTAIRGLAVYDILPQSPGALLLATSGGLLRYEPATRTTARVAGAPEEPSFAILDEQGTTYVGTVNGLIAITAAGLNRVGNLGSRTINTLMRARDGSLLVGSEDAGFFREHAGHWAHFDRARGLPVDTVYALVSDGREGVFVVHHQGAYRLDLGDLAAAAADPHRTLAPEILLDSNPERGAESAECCTGIGRHAGLLHSGALWLTGWGGLLRVGLAPPAQPVPWPKPVIERVLVGGKWLEEPVGPVSVPASARDVTVEFTSPVLAHPAAVRFRYRVEPRDTEWRLIDPTAARSARFTDLSPGLHVLKVETLGPGRDTPLAETELRLQIQPRFRETIWFYACVTAIAALVLLGVHKTRVHTLKARQRDLESTVRERTQELHRANEALRDMAVTDVLTGLHNRRFLDQQIAADVAYLERLRLAEPNRDLVLGFLVVDIDDFKSVNDRHGHAVGDIALTAFADCLRRRVRRGDYVIRWGGEEFLVLARGLRRSDLPTLAQQLLEGVRGGVVDTPAGPLRLTCSVGFAGHPSLPEGVGGTWEDTVFLADAALYEAKRAGRDRWASYQLRGVPDVSPANPKDRLQTAIAAADLVLGDAPHAS